MTESIMPDTLTGQGEAKPNVLYYCDIATEFVDDVPVAWCEWKGDKDQLAFHYQDEFVEIWRCPACDWEWVVYVADDSNWWEEGL